MSKKNQPKNENKKWEDALKDISNGNSFGYVHKKYNISLMDWKKQSAGNNVFKEKLSKATAAFRQFWLQKILEESFDANQREVLIKVFEEHIKEIEEIQTHVLETVEEIVIHVVDHTAVKKKMLRLA